MVDDGSTDGTAEAAREAGAEVRVSRRTAARERPSPPPSDAVRRAASTRWSPSTPTASTCPRRSRKLLGPRAAGPTSCWAPATTCSRRWCRCAASSNRLSSWAISWAAGQPLPDVQTGFRLYSRRLIEATGFPEARFDAESAVVVRAARRGFRVVTVPVRLGFADGRTTSHYRPLVDSLRIARGVVRARLEAGAAAAAGEPGGVW